MLLGACQTVAVLDDTGLPTHKPVSVLLSLQAFARRALRPRRPLAFPMKGDAPSDPLAAWQPVAQAWDAALGPPGGPDIDAMWDAFCMAAESYFLTQQNTHLDRPPQRYRGRASCEAPRMAPVIAPQGRGSQYGALTHRHLRLLKLLRRLEAHHRARLASQPRPGPLPHPEMLRWVQIHQSAMTLLTPDLGWAQPLRSPEPPPLVQLPLSWTASVCWSPPSTIAYVKRAPRAALHGCAPPGTPADLDASTPTPAG